MRKYILSLILIFAVLPVCAEEAFETNGNSNEIPVAASISTGGIYGGGLTRGCPHRSLRRPYGSGFWGNPFNRYRYGSGTLTGFTPPVNYGINSTYYNNPYYSGGFYQTTPYTSTNGGVVTRIKRFFNPNFNNHYLNRPGYNPYLNGNYNNLNNSRYIPLFNGNGGQYYNGYGFDGGQNTNSGATVTIID